MSIQQLSVFLENKPGALGSFVKVLREYQVDMSSLSIAESMDFGIIRAIADNPQMAADVLRDAGYIVQLTPVVAAEVTDKPGALIDILEALSHAGINVDYTYAFLSRKKDAAYIVLRTDNVEKTEDALKRAGIQSLTQLEVDPQ